MNAREYWQLFLETGAPEAHLMYSKQLKSEENHVSDDTRHCLAGDRLQ